jgi:hypothetical protein
MEPMAVTPMGFMLPHLGIQQCAAPSPCCGRPGIRLKFYPILLPESLENGFHLGDFFFLGLYNLVTQRDDFRIGNHRLLAH